MTGLRDARLQKALESAPDAGLRPGERLRQDILAQARRAIAPAPAAPWWKVLWNSAGRRNSPWNAAFATLVIAGFVTVLWFDREVPGPREEPVQAAAPPAPAPPASSPAAPPAAAPSSSAAPSMAVPAERPAAARREAKQPRRSTAPLTSAGGTAQDRAAPADAMRQRRAEAAPSPPEEARALAKSAAPAAEMAAQPPAQEPAAVAAGSVAPRAASIARPVAPPPAAPAAPAPQLSAAATSGWTHAKITSGGREVTVESSQSGRLVALLRAVEQAPRGQEPLDEPASLRIELSRQGTPVSLLEVGGAQVRWTRERGGERRSFVAKPDAAQLQALQAEVDRLAGR